MSKADRAFIFYDPEVIAHKRLEPISKEEVRAAFGEGNLFVFDSSEEMVKALRDMDWHGKNLLLMSSGNFKGLDLKAFAKELLT